MAGIPKKIVQMVLARDRGLCQLDDPGCELIATVADHRANRGMGGSDILNDPACLVAACWRGNQWKETVHGSDLDRLIIRGVRVRRDSTNAKTLTRCLETPVRMVDGLLYWLTSDGRRVPVGDEDDKPF